MLRFLADDVGKELDLVLDAIILRSPEPPSGGGSGFPEPDTHETSDSPPSTRTRGPDVARAAVDDEGSGVGQRR